MLAPDPALAPSPFESFNARTLDPSQVARTFVPSAHYFDLLGRGHALIVGPRGSGKTTLLKMLQPQALGSWEHPDASAAREKIDFTGVFIPTDRTWSQQLELLDERPVDHESASSFLSVAAFTTHVLRSMIDSLDYSVVEPGQSPRYRQFLWDRPTREAILADVSNAWILDVPTFSFAAMRFALGRRLLDIRAISSHERLLGADGRDARLAVNDFLHLDLVSSLTVLLDRIQPYAPPWARLWALLFDELELAPAPARHQLVESLRGADDRLLFKLSMSPYTADARVFQDTLSAMPGHDFREVNLTYAHKEVGYSFSRALFTSMVQERHPGKTAEDALGSSEFDTAPEEWRGRSTAYGPASRLQERLVRLASRDSSFRSYLATHKIDPRRIHQLTRLERAADVRKIASIVAVREEYRAVEVAGRSRSSVRSRSRKSLQLYRGARSFFALTEGNPRWLIGIGSRLITQYDGQHPVSDTTQSRELQKAIQVFRAQLRTIPSRVPGFGRDVRGVLDVLDRIGDYFYERTVSGTFDPEPPGSFIVDSRTDSYLLRALGDALNAGALVRIPDAEGEEVVLTSVRGKQFRLAYLLGADRHLPLVLGRPISLLEALTGGRSTRRARSIQQDLFSGNF